MRMGFIEIYVRLAIPMNINRIISLPLIAISFLHLPPDSDGAYGHVFHSESPGPLLRWTAAFNEMEFPIYDC